MVFLDRRLFSPSFTSASTGRHDDQHQWQEINPVFLNESLLLFFDGGDAIWIHDNRGIENGFRSIWDQSIWNDVNGRSLQSRWLESIRDLIYDIIW